MEDSGSIWEVHRDTDQALGVSGGGAPSGRIQLEEDGVAGSSVGICTDVAETGVEERAGDAARGEDGETDLVEKRLKLWMGEGGRRCGAACFEEPVGEEGDGSVG